ncbi:MAG: aminoacetone oxidase family FAD-binding enzyme [Campylobacterota bacterium]|nr:aminoacetone oxidase family FAD-binding enzyme [Campylobacterota bacterium]
MDNQIAIIGAGASGLITSIILASNGIKVVLYEENSKVGKKLYATGNGRCNITNKNISIDNFYSSTNNFIDYILDSFSFENCKDFFSKLGLEFSINENGRVYPLSLQASSVVEVLEQKAKSYGVDIKLNSKVENIKYKNSMFILNNNYSYSNIIIATGSKAMSKTDDINKGYEFAKSFGHNIIEPFPSLVQLLSDDKNITIANGVKVVGVVEGVKGDILFTNYGLSGSAILDISRNISQKLTKQKNILVTIDTLPSLSYKEILDILSTNIKNNKSQDIYLWLNSIINKKLAKYIIIKSNIPQNIKYTNFLTQNHIKQILKNIKELKINITNTKGSANAEVLAGGVDLKDINKTTMSSNNKDGLYFIGEVLDVDGDCGGYNLHWAWASGYICANSIIKKLEGEKNV